ncbi:winged helix-turn-helix transcriptional regulator [Lactobacillus amylolyticus]|nr:winged helix-turn-helix transcriptional regulator [Lactobacillus amylolyticus]
MVGGKWKPLILRYLDGASKKTLTAQLRELENDGIISRKVIPTVPAA